MAFTIKIDGTEYPSHIIVKNGTLSMSVGENGKKVLNFELVDRSVNGTNYFTNSSLIGKKIELLENGVLKFGGQLDMPKLRKINLVKKNQKVACVDWNFLTEKKYVNKVYYKQPISDIIKKIIDEYLTPDGVYYNSSSINDVTNQLAINCSYSKCQSVLDEISNLIGYKWNIEDNKRFSFKPRNASIGPSIVENSSNYKPKSLVFINDRSEYRNCQILKGVNALTSLLTEKATPTPDDDNTYTVRFPIDARPDIYVTDDINDLRDDDGNYYKVAANLIGIGGLTEGLVWYYWNKGSNTITKDPYNAPEPAAGFFIVVKYVGQYKVDIISEDYDEIEERATIEGTSGKYENVQSGVNIDGITVAENKAEALIAKYAKISNKIKLSSYTIDADVNQLCNMTFPSFEVYNDDYLCVSKKVKDVGAGLLLKSYIFADGDAVGGWIDFFKKWLETGQDFVLRESEEVLQQLRSRERVDWDGNISVLVYNYLFPSDTLFPAETLFPGSYETAVVYQEG